MAYNLFRIACIRQGILQRVVAGHRREPARARSRRAARETAELAWRQVQLHLGG